MALSVKNKVILLAFDSFKDSIDAVTLTSRLAQRLEVAYKHILKSPMADGGEGSLEALSQCLDWKTIHCISEGPYGKPKRAAYLLSRDKRIAVVELAQASGLQDVPKALRQTKKASSFGTGIVISHAIGQGAEHVYILLGGSATTDAGSGMLSALGFRFYKGKEYIPKPQGLDLIAITSCSFPEPFTARFTVGCDVDNPLYGPHGAAFVFARQKGATATDIDLLDRGLRNFAGLLPGKELAVKPGAGAAGGVGFGAMAYLNAQMRPGFDIISQLTGFEEKMRSCDIVITGEGKLDSQTLHRKLVFQIAAMAKKYNKRIIVICGLNELPREDQARLGIEKVFSFAKNRQSVDLSRAGTIKNIDRVSKQLIHYLGKRYTHE